ILTGPQNQTVVAGSDAGFTATATGTPPLSYQWQFKGTNIASATGTSLTLPSVQSSQAGTYTVVVTNASGSASASALLAVISNTTNCVPPASGIVDWWPGEGNGNDIVGANNGTLV